MIEDPSDLEIEDVMVFLQMRKESLGADAVSVEVTDEGHFYEATMSEDVDISGSSVKSESYRDSGSVPADRVAQED